MSMRLVRNSHQSIHNSAKWPEQLWRRFLLLCIHPVEPPIACIGTAGGQLAPCSACLSLRWVRPFHDCASLFLISLSDKQELHPRPSRNVCSRRGGDGGRRPRMGHFPALFHARGREGEGAFTRF